MRGRQARWVAGGLLGAAGLGLAGWVALGKPFSVDEFQYAHAAWLVGRGAVPYRDFFEVHFPLVYLALGPLSRALGDSPLQLLEFRAAMLVPTALALVGEAGLTRGLPRWARWLAPALLLTLAPWLRFAVEIRPDAVASALLLGALALASTEGRAGFARSVGAGFAAGLAFWGAQKVAVAELCLLLPLISGRVHRRGLLLGGALGLLPVAAYLTGQRAWPALWRWCVVWAAEHERGYPALPLGEYLVPLLTEHAVLVSLAALGAAAEVARAVRVRSEEPLLLPLALATTAASIVLQRAAFPYSFLAFLGVACALAVRALVASTRQLAPRPAVRLLAGAAVTALLAEQTLESTRLLSPGNARQREVLRRVGELTAPEDAAYDNSGGYVSRPHAYAYFYTDAYLRSVLAARLERDVPPALHAAGAVLHLRDLRFDGLPARLQRYLQEHYQPYDGDISLWGERYRAGGPLDASFDAVKAARYFVTPPSVLARGRLFVDGQEVRSPTFPLGAGLHALRYEGPPADFDVLWLPRNGEAWVPQRDAEPSFSRLL